MTEAKFHVSNFGCRTSQAEGAAIQEELLGRGGCPAESAYEADVVVVNTCTVTNQADRDALRLIRRLTRRNPETKIIVTGCYAQRRPAELARMPGVRYVVGNSHKSEVAELSLESLGEACDSGHAEVFCSDIFGRIELSSAECQGSSGRTRATIKVQDGCNASCSFCVIPHVRGRSRSLSPREVIAGVRGLIGRGYPEVVFSGIHLGSYGRDLIPRVSFSRLLRRTLQEVPELQRLRLSSIEPLEVTPEILELVAHHPRVASHLHVPLQSGSTSVLRAMRRPYDAAYYLDLLERLRENSPEAAIGADVMVGFPGETDADFLKTYELIEASPLTYLHVFPYSPRPGTDAAGLPNQVPQHVSRFRSRALRALIGKKNEEFRRGFLGRQIQVLALDVTGERGWRAGLSDNFIKVRMPERLEIGRWHELHVSCLWETGLQASQASRTTTAADTL